MGLWVFWASVRAVGGEVAGTMPVEKLVQLVFLMCIPLDCSSSTFPLEVGDLSPSIPNNFGLVPPQLLLGFLLLGVITFFESAFEFSLYLLGFCPVPHPESPLLPVEKSI